jgi:hypothetical protein
MLQRSITERDNQDVGGRAMKTVWVCFDAEGNEVVSAVRKREGCSAYRGGEKCACDGGLPQGTPCNAVEYVPMTALDRLDRLMSEGHYFAYQGGEWHLFRKDGEGCYSGRSPSAIIKMLEAK